MTIDGVSVREAVEADLETLLRLEQELLAFERSFDPRLKSSNALYYDIGTLISDLRTRLMVAEVGGRIVATGYIQLRRSRSALQHRWHGYLGFIFVAEEYRGAGLGRWILEDLMDWGRAQEVRDFYLDVYAGNSAAIRAYEKAGFCASLLEMRLSSSGE